MPNELKGKYAGRGAIKSNVVDKLFRFWSVHVPVSTTKGFVGRLFSEPAAVRGANFKKFWSSDMVNNIDPGEAKSMASFLFPDRPTTPSRTAARRSLLELLASGEDNVSEQRTIRVAK